MRNLDPSALERRLRESEARLDAILRAAVEGIVMIDERGTIELFSASAARMFGWAETDVLGKNVKMLMPDPFRSEHDDYLSNYLRTGIPKIVGIGRETTAVRSDGTTFPIDLSVGEIASFGEGRRFLGIIRDISARVDAENEARRHREQLAHLDRVSTLGEMATGIAHEINQPLAAISTYADACALLVDGGATSLEKIREAAKEISHQAVRAGEVIQSIRSYGRLREAKREAVDLNQVVLEALTLARVELRTKGVRLDFSPAPDLPRANADPVQIQQVVLNLVRNAIEATVSSQEGPRREIVVRTTSQGSNVSVSVADSGAGIPEETRSEVFHPFFSTKEEGMGIGLAICRSIVTAHEGILDFESSPEGTTFFFRLPRATTTTLQEEPSRE